MVPRKYKMLAWDLKSHANLDSAPEMALPNKEETAFFNDHRQKVKQEDLESVSGRRGKYRSIVKLRLVYADPISGQELCYSATGWLIASDDLIVTAAHCVCAKKLEGLARSVEVLVGSNGDGSVETVQRRLGAKVLIPERWMFPGSTSSKLYDFAFIRLKRPFKDVDPLKYEDTPQSGKRVIGVVGYPGDRGDGVERGCQMYEQFDDVTWNIEETDGLLTYPISTFSGNSGSPVLRQTEAGLVAIATHTGGYTRFRNRASPIGTHQFNSYGKIIERFFSGTWPEPSRIFSLSDSGPDLGLDVELHYLIEGSSSESSHNQNHHTNMSVDVEMVHDPMPPDFKISDAGLGCIKILQLAVLVGAAMLGMLGGLYWQKALSSLF